ncbi:MAG: hypothetical protein KDA28_15050 [Phycisphaerales bacterium]|nr:hypothetical protein [Phycisphaerales bacterium]
MTTIDTSPAGQIVPLVTLTIGPNTYRWAANATPLSLAGGTQVFDAAPLMEVEIAEVGAGSEYEIERHQIKMPKVAAIASIARVRTARIEVTIEEIDPADELSRRKLWYGSVVDIEENHLGKRDLMLLVVGGLKELMALPLGIVTGSSCENALGDPICGFDVEGNKHTGTLTIQDGIGLEVVVSGLSYADPRLWYRGGVRRDGLWVPVRGVNTTPNSLDLDFPVPPDWDGQTVDVLPGCDQQLSTCKVRDRESQFTGIGYAMPPYHPLYETQ